MAELNDLDDQPAEEEKKEGEGEPQEGADGEPMEQDYEIRTPGQ